MLTFLAGAEVDLYLLRKSAKPSFTIGIMAFAMPLVEERCSFYPSSRIGR